MTLAHPEAPTPGPFAFPGLSFDDTPRDGAFLMARDAERLHAAGPPSLLWFTWDRPTITVGRLQDAAHALDLARCASDGVPVVTRPTGGRAVFHVDEWTYAAVVPLDHPALGGRLSASCRAIVEVIEGALADAYGLRFGGAGDYMKGSVGACTEPTYSMKSSVGACTAPTSGLFEPGSPLARDIKYMKGSVGACTAPTSGLSEPGSPSARGPGAACFARSFGYETVADGRKLMGSAQRRAGGRLLQQGSLLVGAGHERLGDYLPAGDPTRALARQAVSLTELLGERPDPAPFRAALAFRWAHACEAFVNRGRSA